MLFYHKDLIREEKKKHKSASNMYSQIESIPVTLPHRLWQEILIMSWTVLVWTGLVFGVLILETEWFIDEPKLLRQRHADSSLSRPSVSRMQVPAVFIVDQLKRKQCAEVSIHKLFFYSRQMNLHTRTKKKGCHKYESNSVFNFLNLT